MIRLGTLSAAALAACSRGGGEGDVCSDSACGDGLACVADVGADYGKSGSDDICERPHSMYAIIAYGERGENRRVDDAIAMIDGTFRMPRFTSEQPSIATVPHQARLADGEALTCTGLARGKARDCLVPDWPRYYGTELAQYDRFIFYGLRMVSSLIYTAYYSPPKRIMERFTEATGKRLDADGIQWLRRESRSLALAIIDNFVTHGHRPFALEAMSACYTGTGGYQNPNATWAPALAHWDPAMRIDRGRLDQAEDVPADCTGEIPHTYYELRDSLWYPHAAAFRAVVFANAYYLFRGVLSAEMRDAWLRAIRETGDALALPSSYEPNQNHGITESAALIHLGIDFAKLLPAEVTDAWLRLGRYRLNDLFVDTVFADGVQVEQSLFYHNYQVVLLLEIVDWLEAHDLDLTTDIDPAALVDYDTQAPAPNDPDIVKLDLSTTLEPADVLDSMVRASVHLAQPDGWIPLIGTSAPQQFRGYSKSVLDGYVEAGRSSASLLRFYQTGGTEGTPPPDADRLKVFEDSGFVTMHSAFKPDFTQQTHVVFNAGVPYHKHSHPDALSVHLFGPDTTPKATSGTALLIDSGWYSYEAIGAHYFKSTMAHNTVTVDGLNQCVRNGPRMRLDPYVDIPLPSCADLSELDPDAGIVTRGTSVRGKLGDTTWLYQSARHTLYRGTIHRRAVLLFGHEMLAVVDMLESTQPRTFSQNWHVAARVPPLSSVPAPIDGAYHVPFARSADDPAPLFGLHQATEGAELVVHHGDPGVGGVFGQGWYSTQENLAEPNLVIELRHAGVTQTAFASVFLLGKRATEDAEVTLRRDTTSSGSLTIRAQDGKMVTLDIQNLADAAEVVTIH